MTLRHVPEQLEAMVRHVTYEHSRLWVWLNLSMPAPHTGDPEMDALVIELLSQARLESGLLHLRVLADFLSGKRNDQYPTGLVADDYFDDGWPAKPNVVIGKDTNEQKAILDDLHQRLAHLSLRRLDDETDDAGFSWTAVTLLAPKVLATFDTFRDDLALLHPERAAWFNRIPRVASLR